MNARHILTGLIFLTSPLFAAESHTPDLAQELSFYAISLIGTPYKHGGRHPETGLDCSGLITHLFSRIAGIDLPRTSREMGQRGVALEADELQPGDLVFFDTLDQPFSHVGLYVGEHRFIHASSSRTGVVMLSDMSMPYWSSRFNGARRMLLPAEASVDGLP